MVARLVCGTCGEEHPVPQHCNQPMVMDAVELALQCKVCGTSMKLPECCNGPLEFWE